MTNNQILSVLPCKVNQISVALEIASDTYSRCCHSMYDVVIHLSSQFVYSFLFVLVYDSVFHQYVGPRLVITASVINMYFACGFFVLLSDPLSDPLLPLCVGRRFAIRPDADHQALSLSLSLCFSV
jgi:hypothetical protein